MNVLTTRLVKALSTHHALSLLHGPILKHSGDDVPILPILSWYVRRYILDFNS